VVKNKRHRVAEAQRDEGMKTQRRKINATLCLCIFVSLCLCASATLCLGLGDVPWGRNPFLTKEEMNSLRKKETLPTSPTSMIISPFPQWEVKSILTSGSGRVATVNDHIVKVGDFLGEERVLEINEDSVVLGSKGKRRLLRQRQPSIPIKVEEERWER